MNASRRAAATAAALIVLVLLAFIAFRYFDARKGFYYQDGELIGKAVLLTCFSRSPIFLYGGMPSDTDLPEPLFAKLEVEHSCKAIKDHAPALVEDRSGPYQTNRTFYELLNIPYCSHPSFSAAMAEQCEEGRYEALRWLIEQGVDLDTPSTCGYLRSAVMHMDENLFNFLLEHGADPFSICLAYKPETPREKEHQQHTVGGILESLLAEYTDTERATIVAPMTRMLETIRRESIERGYSLKPVPEHCTQPGLDYVQWVQEYFEAADVVMLAMVTAVSEHRFQYPPTEPPESARSMKELIELIAARNRYDRGRTVSLSLEVDKSWKGQPGSTIDVLADMYASDTGTVPLYQTGKSYLIFGFWKHVFVPGQCAIDTDAKNTASMMRALDVVTARP